MKHVKFSATVRDHMMIAHSLDGAVFGPAQRLHGATYVVDATFHSASLTGDGIVVDLGRAAEELKDTLAGMTYRNLDEEPDFAGRNTTTEALAFAVAEQLARRVAEGRLGPSDHLTRISVTLHESHIASASCEVVL